MNSSIQCLKRINELKEFLEKNKAKPNQGPEYKITKALGNLFIQLEKSGDRVNPMEFVSSYMTVFP